MLFSDLITKHLKKTIFHIFPYIPQQNPFFVIIFQTMQVFKVIKITVKAVGGQFIGTKVNKQSLIKVGEI